MRLALPCSLVLAILLAAPAAAQVVIDDPEPVPTGLQRLVAEASRELLKGQRDDFLALFALAPDYEALQRRHGEDLGFEDRDAFADWADELVLVRRAADEFYDDTSAALLESSRVIDDFGLVEVRGDVDIWRGMPSAAAPRAVVQLNHALRAVIRYGRAVKLDDRWLFVGAPSSQIEVLEPELRGTDVDVVDVEDGDASLP